MREAAINLVVAAATVAAAAAAGYRWVWGVNSVPEAQGRVIANWRAVGSVGSRMGPPSAAVTIVEFSDFQCSYCAQAAGVLREIRRRFPAEVTVVYRHFPLTERTLDAAVAAECGNQSGRFEAMHDLLFAQADSIGRKSWTAFALEVGVTDTGGFRRCLSSGNASAAVWRDIHSADSIQVGQTPTILVNDRMFVGTPVLPALERYVRRTLGR